MIAVLAEAAPSSGRIILSLFIKASPGPPSISDSSGNWPTLTVFITSPRQSVPFFQRNLNLSSSKYEESSCLLRANLSADWEARAVVLPHHQGLNCGKATVIPKLIVV